MIASCELLFRFQSSTVSMSGAVLDALFIIVPVVFTFTVIVNVAVVPLLRVPMSQIPVVSLYVPVPWVLADWNINPVGNKSVICIPVALSGPLFFAVMVMVMVSPFIGLLLDTVCVTSMSAATGARLALIDLALC